MTLAEFGVRRPVVANLVMFAILAAGVVFGGGLRKEFFPEVSPGQVIIAAPYPGAAPSEVESALAIKIEDALAELSDIVEIATTVREGAASIRVEYEEGVDIDEAVAEVKRTIDALQDLPDGAERIVPTKVEPNLPAVVISIYGDHDEREMKRAIREIREDLRSLPGMGDVSEGGFRRDEITVEVRPAALLEHGISLQEVAARINAAMRELPGGTVRTPTANFGLRPVGVDENAPDVRGIVVRALPDGRALRLGDIAEVRDDFTDTPLISRLNGLPSVNATVFSGSDDDIVEIAEMAKAYVRGRNGEPFVPTTGERVRALLRAPGDETPVSAREQAWSLGHEKAHAALPGTLTTTTDLARFVVGRLDLLTRNAVAGGLLVFATLVLFLNWRVSFWVAAGLIVALAGTLVMMRFAGITLNLLSMFGLIIVVGILVDDAIVVAENIVSRHEAGEPALVAAINGAGQVAWPVVATVMTTVFAFLPLGLIQGEIGDFLGVLPVVVAVSLLVSLVESLFILPSHMGHSLKATDRAEREHRRTLLGNIERRADRARDLFIQRFVVRGYAAVLRRALGAPYTTLLLAVAATILSLGMIAGGRLEFIFFETDDAETVNAEVRMPVGTPLDAADAFARRLEAAVSRQPEVTSFFTSVGSISSLDGASDGAVSTDALQIVMELAPIEERDRASPEIIQAIRDELGPTPEVRSLRMGNVGGGPDGPALNYAIVGTDLDQLERASADVVAALAEYDGVVDIATDFERGKREVRIDLRPGAAELGFTRESLGRQVQGFVFGIEAFTFAGTREDVDVRVMLPQAVRRSIAAIEDQYVYTPAGLPAPLREVADITETRADSTIRRLDRRRVIRISADVNSAVANPEIVSAELEPVIRGILDRYPGASLQLEGRQQELAESFATLPVGMLAAAGLIYVTLAWLFGSYTQPLIVMTAIPFGVIGMVWGHVLMGYKMTFLSLIGFVALSGVVVNDSLIFMEFFNERRREGMTVFDAAMASGRARVRAILLTTITTVFGLLPLMLEQSFQARFLIPMAITIAFGLISGTVLILLVLPSLLMILSDVKRSAASLWRGERVTQDLYEDPALELDRALERHAGGQA